MKNRLKQIGFSQRIRLEWFECTANLVLDGRTKEEIYTDLSDFLRDKLSMDGAAKRGNREKTISILMKCWVTVPVACEFLRDEGLNLLKHLPLEEHLVVHWGMAMAVYPFWGTVAEITGRLLRLQDTVTTVQVQRRIRELLGERETVFRATRRVLRAFIDWGVLEETSNKGIYRQGIIRNLTDVQLISWIIEAVLISNGSNSASLKTITHSPPIFPFNIALPNSRVLEKSKRLEIFHQSLDEEMVTLRSK